MANPNQLAALIPDPTLPAGHPLGGTVAVSASMPVYVEPTADDCDAEFRKAVVASARQTIKAAGVHSRNRRWSGVFTNDELTIELRNARALAEAILQELGEDVS